MKYKKLAVFVWLSFLLSSCAVNIFAAVDHDLKQPVVHLADESQLEVPVTGSGLYGTPAKPIEYKREIPPGFFEFNNEDHYLYKQTIHDRQVTIAWEKDQIAAEEARHQAIAYIVCIFGGRNQGTIGLPHEGEPLHLSRSSQRIE